MIYLPAGRADQQGRLQDTAPCAKVSLWIGNRAALVEERTPLVFAPTSGMTPKVHLIGVSGGDTDTGHNVSKGLSVTVTDRLEIDEGSDIDPATRSRVGRVRNEYEVISGGAEGPREVLGRTTGDDVGGGAT